MRMKFFFKAAKLRISLTLLTFMLFSSSLYSNGAMIWTNGINILGTLIEYEGGNDNEFVLRNADDSGPLAGPEGEPIEPGSINSIETNNGLLFFQAALDPQGLVGSIVTIVAEMNLNYYNYLYLTNWDLLGAVEQTTRVGAIAGIYGEQYLFDFDIKRYRTGQAFPDVYIGVETNEIFPSALISSAMLGGRIHAYFVLRAIQPDGTRITLPYIEAIWNQIKNVGDEYVYKVPSEYEDIVWENDVELSVVLTDEPLFGSENQITQFECGLPIDLSLPPAPINLDVVELSGYSVSLGWSIPPNSDITSYRIFRSTESNFIPSENLQISETTAQMFTDNAVTPVTTYYYKVQAIDNYGNGSNYSNQLVATPRTDFILTLNQEDLEAVVNSNLQILGLVLDNDEQIVPECEVKIAFDSTGWESPVFMTDEMGLFSGSIPIPTNPGTYTLNISMSKSGNTSFRGIPINVLPIEYFTPNIALSNLTTSDRIVDTETTSSIDFSYTIKNDGNIQAEDLILYYQLFTSNGGQLDTDFSPPLSILPNDSLSLNTTIELPENITPGIYTLSVSALTYEDEFHADNHLNTTIKVGGYRSSQSYKLNEHILTIDGGLSIGSQQIVFTDYDELVGYFNYNDEIVSLSSGEYWLSGDNILLYASEYVVIPDDTTCFLRAGTFDTSNPIIQNSELAAYAGENVQYSFTGSSNTAYGNTIEILAWADGNAVSSWDNEFSQQANHAQIDYTIPQESPQDTWEWWLKIEDQSSWWIIPQYLSILPNHDLEIASFTYENGFPNNIVGDTYSIEIDVSNCSCSPFREVVPLEVQILGPQGSKFTMNSENYTIDPGSDRNLSFSWNSIGQDEGYYQVLARLYNPQTVRIDTFYAEELFLDINPQLQLSFVSGSLVSEVNEEVELTFDFTYDNQHVDSVNTSVTIITPTNHEIVSACFYNPGNQSYRLPYNPSMAGNYRIVVKGDKYRFEEVEETYLLQVYGVADFGTQKSQYHKGEVVFLDISTENIGNVGSFASDIIYDPSKLKFLQIAEGNLFAENDQTTVQYFDDNGNLTLGYTRLSNIGHGAVTVESKRILQVLFKALDEGEAQFEPSLVSFFESGSATPILTHHNNAMIEIYDFDQHLILSSNADSVSVAELDTLYLYIANPTNLYSISGDLLYDPTQVSIQSVFEGNLLNDYGHETSLFLTSNDVAGGQLTFGGSRTGTSQGVTDQFRSVIGVAYTSSSTNPVSIELSNLELLSPGLDVSYSNSLSYDLPFVLRDSVTIGLTPPSQYVEVDSFISLNTTIGPVSDIFAVACDVQYDPNIISFQSIDEGVVFNEGGTVSTNFLVSVDSISGRIIVGLSRLSGSGLDITETSSLFSLTFQKRANGDTEVGLENIGLISADGTTTYPFSTSPCYIYDMIYPPILDDLPPILFDEDENYTLSMSEWYDLVTDFDTPDTLLQWTVMPSINLSTNVIGPSEIAISPLPNWFGIDTLLVIVSDGISSDSTSLFVTVESINDTPDSFSLLSPVDDYVIMDPDSVDIEFRWESSSDIEGDPLEYRLVLSTSDWDTSFSLPDTTFRANVEPFPRGEEISWMVTVDDGMGGIQLANQEFHFVVDVIVGIKAGLPIPTSFSMKQNFPNPFNPSTTIRYGLPEASNIQLSIFDIQGRLVRTLDRGNKQIGWHEVVWNGNDDNGRQVSAGTYFAQIQAANHSEVIKMVYLR